VAPSRRGASTPAAARGDVTPSVARAAFGASPPAGSGTRRGGSGAQQKAGAGAASSKKGNASSKGRGGARKTPGGPSNAQVMKLLSRMWKAEKEGGVGEGKGGAMAAAVMMMTDLALDESKAKP
jgi:hypothetical protein